MTDSETMTSTERMRLLLVVCAAGLLLIVWLWPAEQTLTFFSKKTCECLSVSFLDVGQGDAILIETPDGLEVLVDGGRDASVLRTLAKERSFFDREIDVIVSTHPDLDHVGGLIDVLKRYRVKQIIQTENEHDTPAAAAFTAAAKQEQAEIILADVGQVISIGASTTLYIFSPAGDEREWESNTASIVMKVVYGNSSFMLTGDAPAEIENYLVETYGTQLDSDVLKLGHHGSKTSSSESFLDAVTPQFAIVSAGIDNRYGHPHQEVMERVFGRDITTFHTGTDGTVTFQSDGQTVWKK
jgi:competence protein ComEC